MTPDQLAALSAREYAAAFGYFRMFPPPENHAWIGDSSGLSWFDDDSRRASRHAASIQLRRALADVADHRQLRAEIGLSWEHDGTLAVRRRAIVSCARGNDGTRRSLLADGAGDYEDTDMTRLCARIAGDLVAAIRRHNTDLATA